MIPRFSLFLMGGVVLTVWAQWRLGSTWRRWSNRSCAARPLTGAQVARELLDAAGLDSVKVERVDGALTDHYDPGTRVLRLSCAVHDQDSLAAVGVAAHETGHALQHRDGYGPLRLRQALLPFMNLGARVALPLVAAGLLLRAPPLALAGVGLFLGLLFFQLLALPVEFDASRRAEQLVQRQGLVSAPEMLGVRQILRAAAWTYVAAFTMTFVQWLRFLRLVR